MNIKSLLTNYIGVIFLTFLSLLGSFLTNIFINFQYGKEIFGYFSTIYNIALFFSVFIAFGVGQYMLREISIDKNKFIGSISYLRKILLFTYIFSFLAYIIFTSLSNYEYDLKILILISLPIIFLLGVINLFSNIKLVDKKFMSATVVSTAFHIIMLVSILFVLLLKLDFPTFILLLSFISLLVTGYMFLKVNKYLTEMKKLTNITVDYKQNSFGKIFKEVYPFGVIGLMYYIYYQSDIILISLYLDSNAVAEYNAAFSILAALLVFPKILYQKLLAPYIYERWQNNKENKKILKYQLYIIIISTLIYILIILLSDYLINLLFGENYNYASDILMILGFSFVLRFVYGFSSVIMNFKENLKSKMNIMTITALLNIILNLIFIPIYGVFGAAISTIFSEVLLCILMVRKYIKIRRSL